MNLNIHNIINLNRTVYHAFYDHQLNNSIHGIRPIAKLAYEGKGEQKCGDWCRFCRAKPVCKACAEEALALAREEFLERKAYMANKKNFSPTKELIPCRISYANIWEAKAINGGEEKYSVSCLVPKSDTKTLERIERVFEDMDAAMIEEAFKTSVLRILRTRVEGLMNDARHNAPGDIGSGRDGRDGRGDRYDRDNSHGGDTEWQDRQDDGCMFSGCDPDECFTCEYTRGI